MSTAELRDDASDMERFAARVLRYSVSYERVSQFERSVRWGFPGSKGCNRTIALRSGIELNLTQLAWERPWTFQFNDTATALKFQLARGASLRMTPAAGPSYVSSAGQFRVRHTVQASPAACEFLGSDAECEQFALEVDPQRLRELCGTAALPTVLEQLVTSEAPRTMHEQPMAPALLQVMDDLFYCDAKGASRQLYLEAKGLELLSILVGELEVASEASRPFGRRDVERLERARCVLITRMETPPRLGDLARQVGLNELKLKQGFRSLYGTSVYGYLRGQRMETARRLLGERELSVTEVALRVGYANPSKFAAAFRRHFGVAPSALRC